MPKKDVQDDDLQTDGLTLDDADLTTTDSTLTGGFVDDEPAETELEEAEEWQEETTTPTYLPSEHSVFSLGAARLVLRFVEFGVD